VPLFVVSQVVGALAGMAVMRWMLSRDQFSSR
jgi:hypothetical protein